jgi:predicted GNAT family acetyltransferase
MIPGVTPPAPLQAQYDALQLAIGTGVRVVRFQDRTVEYASIDDMIKAANYLYQLLNPAGSVGSRRQIRFYTNKGL